MGHVFGDLRSALRFAVDSLVDVGHPFIIDVRSPEDVKSGPAANLQIVDEDRVFGTGEHGLTLYLPFDAASGEAEHLRRFERMEGASEFVDCTWDGIPCFAKRFGRDVEAAVAMSLRILQKVCNCAAGTPYECTVYDEGEDEECDDAESDEADFEPTPWHQFAFRYFQFAWEPREDIEASINFGLLSVLTRAFNPDELEDEDLEVLEHADPFVIEASAILAQMLQQLTDDGKLAELRVQARSRGYPLLVSVVSTLRFGLDRIVGTAPDSVDDAAVYFANLAAICLAMAIVLRQQHPELVEEVLS